MGRVLRWGGDGGGQKTGRQGLGLDAWGPRIIDLILSLVGTEVGRGRRIWDEDGAWDWCKQSTSDWGGLGTEDCMGWGGD